MNIFRVRTIVNLGPDERRGATRPRTASGECFKSPNWADWPLVANSQQNGTVDWTFPDGVANVLQPDEWLMLQTHYVNASTQKTPTPARCAVNFWTMPEGRGDRRDGDALRDQAVDPRSASRTRTPTFQGSCQFKAPNPVHVIGANGHFHSRGTTFDIYTWDGTSTDHAADARPVLRVDARGTSRR